MSKEKIKKTMCGGNFKRFGFDFLFFFFSLVLKRPPPPMPQNMRAFQMLLRPLVPSAAFGVRYLTLKRSSRETYRFVMTKAIAALRSESESPEIDAAILCAFAAGCRCLACLVEME